MSWSCPVCQKDFSRKDNLQRHMNSKHSNSNFTPVIPMSQEKCQRFQFEHPFTCMVAGMTGSGKTIWVQSLLRQAYRMINLPPERIVWCYSQWQPAYMEMLVAIPNIEFVKGIPESLENDSYLDVNIRNLIVFDDQMIEAGKDNRIVNLFTKGSHHRNLSVIYIVQNLFHQGKGNRSISLNSHYLVLFKNPRDKLQVLTLAKQMYPGRTDFFLKQYEEAVRRPYGYLLIDLKTTTRDDCRLRTNVLPGEEIFNQVEKEENIPQELLRYLKLQTLMVPPPISEMQRIQNNMDNLLYRTNLGEDQKAKQYMQLQNKFLNYKHQLKSLIPEATIPTQPQEPNQMSTNVLTGNVPTAPNPVQKPPEIIPATPVQAPTQLTAPQALSTMATSSSISSPAPPPSILTPPPTVETLSPVRKRKRPQSVKFVNYLDYEPKKASRRSRRLHRTSPYKYSQYDEDD